MKGRPAVSQSKESGGVFPGSCAVSLSSAHTSAAVSASPVLLISVACLKSLRDGNFSINDLDEERTELNKVDPRKGRSQHFGKSETGMYGVSVKPGQIHCPSGTYSGFRKYSFSFAQFIDKVKTWF